MTPQEKQQAWHDWAIRKAHGKGLGENVKKEYDARIKAQDDPRVAAWHALYHWGCLSLEETLNPDDEFPTVVLPSE